MWTLHARLSAIATAILLLSFANQPAFPRGSQVLHDDPLNSEHIDRLPPEVRNVIIRMCGDALFRDLFRQFALDEIAL